MTIDYPAVMPWVGYNVHYLEDIVCLLIGRSVKVNSRPYSVTTPGS